MYNKYGDVSRSWNCTDIACTCEGEYCSGHTLTVSIEGTSPKLSPFFDCRIYGNTVKYEKDDGGRTGLYEIAIIRKQGKTTVRCHCSLINHT